MKNLRVAIKEQIAKSGTEVKNLKVSDKDNQVKLSKEEIDLIKKGLHLDETFKVHELFAAWSKAFYGYIVLEKYSKTTNCKIFNA
ncbi:MAG: hypothetical protein ACJ75J_06825, partial [Cytophagaceae bacterium]